LSSREKREGKDEEDENGTAKKKGKALYLSFLTYEEQAITSELQTSSTADHL
jgi:hypothetical protein